MRTNALLIARAFLIPWLLQSSSLFAQTTSSYRAFPAGLKSASLNVPPTREPRIYCDIRDVFDQGFGNRPPAIKMEKPLDILVYIYLNTENSTNSVSGVEATIIPPSNLDFREMVNLKYGVKTYSEKIPFDFFDGYNNFLINQVTTNSSINRRLIAGESVSPGVNKFIAQFRYRFKEGATTNTLHTFHFTNTRVYDENGNAIPHSAIPFTFVSSTYSIIKESAPVLTQNHYTSPSGQHFLRTTVSLAWYNWQLSKLTRSYSLNGPEWTEVASHGWNNDFPGTFTSSFADSFNLEEEMPPQGAVFYRLSPMSPEEIARITNSVSPGKSLGP